MRYGIRYLAYGMGTAAMVVGLAIFPGAQSNRPGHCGGPCPPESTTTTQQPYKSTTTSSSIPAPPPPTPASTTTTTEQSTTTTQATTTTSSIAESTISTSLPVITVHKKPAPIPLPETR